MGRKGLGSLGCLLSVNQRDGNFPIRPFQPETHSSEHPPVDAVSVRVRRMRAIKGIDRRVTRKLGVVPFPNQALSTLSSFENNLRKFSCLIADPEVDIAPTVKGIRFPRFHFQPSPRRGQLISIGQKATTKLGEGRKGIRHTGRVAYLNEYAGK